MADKPTNKERLKELGEKIEAGIREVFDSGKYAEYLKVMSPFPLVKDIVGYLKMCHSILPIKR